MKPGPELDVLVAEKVMGFKRERCHMRPRHFASKDFPGKWLVDHDSKGPHEYLSWELPDPMASHNDAPTFERRHYLCGCSGHDLPEYSTDIAAAWEVATRFKVFSLATRSFMGDGWVARIQQGLNSVQEVIAPTAPHAICLAALKAVGMEVK
jgi:hypothetical protein